MRGRCCATREMPGHSQLGYQSLSSSSLLSLDSQGFSALRPELPSGLSRLYKETQHSFQVLELLVSVPFEVLYFFKGKLKSFSFMRSELCKPFFLCSLPNDSTAERRAWRCSSLLFPGRCCCWQVLRLRTWLLAKAQISSPLPQCPL